MVNTQAHQNETLTLLDFSSLLLSFIGFHIHSLAIEGWESVSIPNHTRTGSTKKLRRTHQISFLFVPKISLTNLHHIFFLISSFTRSGDPNDLDLASVYLSYAETGVGDGQSRPRTGRQSKSARPKSSKLRSRR